MSAPEKEVADSVLIQSIVRAAMEGTSKAVEQHLGGYQSPLKEIVARAVRKREGELSTLVDGALDAVLAGETFRRDLQDAMKSKLAKVLVASLGGEIEKRVTALKADPTTRARITLALSKAVDDLLQEVSE